MQNLGVYFDKTIKQQGNKEPKNDKKEKTWEIKEVWRLTLLKAKIEIEKVTRLRCKNVINER